MHADNTASCQPGAHPYVNGTHINAISVPCQFNMYHIMSVAASSIVSYHAAQVSCLPYVCYTDPPRLTIHMHMHIHKPIHHVIVLS